MIIRFIEDDLLSISFSSVMGTEKAGDGGLKHLPPRRLGLIQRQVRSSIFSKNHYLGLNATGCRCGGGSFFG